MVSYSKALDASYRFLRLRPKIKEKLHESHIGLQLKDVYAGLGKNIFLPDESYLVTVDYYSRYMNSTPAQRIFGRRTIYQPQEYCSKRRLQTQYPKETTYLDGRRRKSIITRPPGAVTATEKRNIQSCIAAWRPRLEMLQRGSRRTSRRQNRRWKNLMSKQ